MSVYLSTNVLFSEWRSSRNPSDLKMGALVGIRGRKWRLVFQSVQVCYLDHNERLHHRGSWWAVYEFNGINWLARVGESRAPFGGTYGPIILIDPLTVVRNVALRQVGT